MTPEAKHEVKPMRGKMPTISAVPLARSSNGVNHSSGNKTPSAEMQFGARIKVVGVGGSGGNAIDHMIDSGVGGVDFIAVNCDVQDLHHNKARGKIHIGKNLTRGLGAGMNPEVGKRGAEETKTEIQDVLRGADLVFITCGLGGGTGTGAAPIIAEIAKNQGSLTIAVVTNPFSFEGAERSRIAEEGFRRLIEAVDTVIVIPNDRLLEISDKKTTLKNAFAVCDDVLKNAVQGISELILKPGIINVDFADIRAIMAEAGPAIMGIGQATGDTRAVEAAKSAISSPLLDISIDGAKGVLFVVAGGDDMSLFEMNEAAKIITASADLDAKIIFGAIHDESVPKGAVKITVIAAGFSNPSPNGTAGSSKSGGIKYEEKQDDEGKSQDNFSDMDIPAFLRREKEKSPLRPKLTEEERRQKPEHFSGISAVSSRIRDVNAVTALEIASLAPDKSKLSPAGSSVIIKKPVSNTFLEKYKNHNDNQSARGNGLRNFKEGENFHPVRSKMLRVSADPLIVDLTSRRVQNNTPAFYYENFRNSIYKTGSVIRNWFRGMIY